jgi:long-chain acyl-CoA synthetase
MDRAVLMTGTGTVGRELLLALLRRTDDRVVVLMRDRGRRTAAGRAAALFDMLGLSADERQRVTTVRGDITSAGLGLDMATQEWLVETLDIVVHTAAMTSLTADPALCQAVNSTGTTNTLMLAEQCFSGGPLERFVHLSTAMVAGGHSAAVAVEDALPLAPAHANAYESSKYEGERIVRAAMQGGLPVVIVRPSMVVGETETGWTRDFNVIYPLMRIMASGYLTRFPAIAAAPLHIAPLDFVVDGIMRALDEPWAVGRTFHLTAPEPPSVADLFECDGFFPAQMRRPTLCAPEDFDIEACSGRERELLESLAFCLPYFASCLTFDTTNTKRLVPVPVTDRAYLERLGRYAVESGYIRHAAA